MLTPEPINKKRELESDSSFPPSPRPPSCITVPIIQRCTSTGSTPCKFRKAVDLSKNDSEASDIELGSEDSYSDAEEETELEDWVEWVSSTAEMLEEGDVFRLEEDNVSDTKTVTEVMHLKVKNSPDYVYRVTYKVAENKYVDEIFQGRRKVLIRCILVNPNIADK